MNVRGEEVCFRLLDTSARAWEFRTPRPFSGIHHCVGAPLARRVVVAAIEELLGAVPALRLARPFEPIPIFASLTALAPVRVEVAA